MCISSPPTSYQHSILISEAAGSNTPPSLTEHLVLHRAVGVIQVQEELLEEELQMGSAELRVVVFGQAGQPQPEGLKGDAAHLLAAVVQTLQQLFGEKTPTYKTLVSQD